ncbi:cell division protein [Stutzerimonas stutzeri]|uniref:Cell division protein n=1 Tax=Stutzerimonas stutzeri TaxID=316 RepID=W8R3G6_STUST|nr:AAA family ATPase [Stutzerimonas stutzeri]AHL74033.1 cell division protein [Stutzerimonas stutzeri]MCQ4328443.1 AAA family ATPase [Stutzerimonas stutzeri]
MTSLSADDSYLNHYGFSHDPFAARVPGFKFFPAQRKPVLGQLHHLARYSQLLLVVTGPEGSGKTLVRQALVASSNKQAVQSVVVSPQETVDSNAVLQQIAQALGSQDADFESIMAQIIQLALTGQEVYVLVDDAERLTGAAVETLLRLAQGSPQGRPHVFLFGEHALVDRLEALVEGEERFHVIALQPYEEDETREYLALRLEGAGGGLDCFSEEQIVHIHENSGGWPGAINQAARDELLDAMQHSKAHRKSAGWRLPLPMKHVLALAAVVCVVVIALLMRDSSDQSMAPTTASLPLDAGRSASPSQEPSSIELGEREGSALDLVPPQPEQPLIREPLAAAGSAETDDSSGALIEESAVNGDPARDESQAPAEAGSPAPVQNSATEPVLPSEVSREPARQVVAKPAAVAPAADWYASQPKTNYLVQVLGTRTRSNAEALVKQRGNSFRYFVKQHEGKPLYVVTHGSFPSRNAALEAIKALPASLKAGKPWARSFASVQQEISQAR